MAWPVTTVAARGLPVTEVTARGLPVSEAGGFGVPVTIVAARGLPVTFVGPTSGKTVLVNSPPNIILTNGGLTATKAAGADTTYATILSQSTRGGMRVYAEVHFDTIGGDPAFGIALPTELTTKYLGQTTNSFGFYTDGSVLYNDADVGLPSTPYTAGVWWGMAVDRSARTLKFRNITGAGAWSAAVNIAGLGSSDICAGCSVVTAPGAYTFNFDGTFLGTPPAGGYTRWGGAPL